MSVSLYIRVGLLVNYKYHEILVSADWIRQNIHSVVPYILYAIGTYHCCRIDWQLKALVKLGETPQFRNDRHYWASINDATAGEIIKNAIWY